MSAPTQLVIGGIPYSITKVNGSIEELVNGDLVLGRILYQDQTILLSDLMKQEYAGKVLLHEAIHGLLHEYGMDRHNKEAFVSQLTVAFFDFIRNNDLSFVTGKHQPPAVKPAPVMVKAPVVEASKEDKRPRQLPLLGGSNSAFSLGDMVKIKTTTTEKEDHWETGIKLKEGVKTYRTRYICPICGNRGKRYIPIDQSRIECHSCGEKLQKRPATASGFPDRDDFGNYFTATEIYTERA